MTNDCNNSETRMGKLEDRVGKLERDNAVTNTLLTENIKSTNKNTGVTEQNTAVMIELKNQISNGEQNINAIKLKIAEHDQALKDNEQKNNIDIRDINKELIYKIILALFSLVVGGYLGINFM